MEMLEIIHWLTVQLEKVRVVLMILSSYKQFGQRFVVHICFINIDSTYLVQIVTVNV